MLEIGQVARGVVLRLMPYGVMVRLESGVVGLVHISEVANCFVEDLSQRFDQGARVVVRVLRQRDDGRWEFSIKKARDAQLPDAIPDGAADNFGAGQPMYDAAVPYEPSAKAVHGAQKREAFNAKLQDFLSDSSENLEDARRHDENRRKGKRR